MFKRDLKMLALSWGAIVVLLLGAVLVLGQNSPNLASCNRYVSPGGSDWNSGTSTSSPWKSPEKAFGSAAPGQTVCLMGGTYAKTVSSGYNQTFGRRSLSAVNRCDFRTGGRRPPLQNSNSGAAWTRRETHSL